jgi:hypothetical protein
MIFEWDNFEKYEDLISEYLKKDEVKIIVEIDAKNTIPRFNIWETTPYEIGNVKYTNWIFVIYVKIFDEISFNSFFECLKNTFESIWFWKAKGRWYGHFENIKLENLVDEEIKVFEYFEKLRRERWLYFILNNYKPTDEEIDNMDLNKSYYKINLKHTKTLSELEKNVFKWQMNFFSEWSVIFSAEKLIWNFYKFENSYNFWYIF